MTCELSTPNAATCTTEVPTGTLYTATTEVPEYLPATGIETGTLLLAGISLLALATVMVVAATILTYMIEQEDNR